MSSIEDPTKTVVAATTSPATGRARRKSAKAAAAFVAAAVKEEMLVPPVTTQVKRSYSRGNSQGSVMSSVSHASEGGGGGGVAKDSKGRPKKKTALSSYAVEYLKAWMMSPDHIEHPYPTEDEKLSIMKDTGIELKQLTNWFVNNRKRYWKPKVEEMKRQSGTAHVSLQEIAAAAQSVVPAPVPRPPAVAVRKASMVVSSEGEESTGSLEQRKLSSAKKRKKYSTLSDERAAASAVPAVANRTLPMRSAKKAKEGQSAAAVANPIIPVVGIATAATHASVKAARKMSHDSSSKTTKTTTASSTFRKASRIISETISSSETESDGDEKSPMIKPTAVSNPLNSMIPNLQSSSCSSSSIEDEDALVNDPIITTTESSVPMTALSGQATQQQQQQQQQAVPQVADLDYSITPLDSEVVANTANTGPASAAATVAASGFCYLPHSCNLGDPSGAKNLTQPCALCSACRDWNLGEFCPWDLTGIIGDISNDMEIPDLSTEANKESTKEKDQEEVPITSASDMDGSTHGSTEEATTITKNSTSDGAADLASIDGNIEPNAVDDKNKMMMSSNPSTDSFTVPQEIHHSTSADFISSMVDMENWD